MANYIAELSKDVERKYVRYDNRYGLAIAVDLYQAKAINGSETHPVIIVGAPYGGVREQGPCVYTNELVKKGFVVLTSDQSFMGESAGEPRNLSSPEILTENFSAAADYPGVKVPYVDCDKIGIVGIYGPGGFALSAAQADTRIKAVATASMYVMTTAVHGTQDQAALAEMKKRLSLKWREDFEQGYPKYIPSFPEEPIDAVSEGMPEPGARWFRFYAVKGSHHSNARGGFTTTSDLVPLDADLTAFVGEISPRPVLSIAGDRAHSEFSPEMVYGKVQEPEELYVVGDAEYIDLYDRTDRIPFDKPERFFRENL